MFCIVCVCVSLAVTIQWFFLIYEMAFILISYLAPAECLWFVLFGWLLNYFKYFISFNNELNCCSLGRGRSISFFCCYIFENVSFVIADEMCLYVKEAVRLCFETVVPPQRMMWTCSCFANFIWQFFNAQCERRHIIRHFFVSFNFFRFGV